MTNPWSAPKLNSLATAQDAQSGENDFFFEDEIYCNPSGQAN